MAGQSRVFNAISGKELKAFILKEISDAFNQVHDFTTEVITFPVVRWQWDLRMSVYPRTPQDINLQKSGERIASDVQPGEIGGTQPIELQGANAIGASGMLAPDQAREEAGLPVPTLQRDRKTGAMFDELVTQKQPTDEESWHPPGARSAVIDRTTGRGGAKK